MIVEIDASVLPTPITIDLAGKGGSSTLVPFLKPSIKLRTGPGGAELASWAPNGAPSSKAPAFVAILAVAVLFTFAAIGVAKTLK